MLFIQKALQAKQDSTSLIDTLMDRLAGYRKQRTHKIVHISDLSRPEGFCPREFALLDATNKQPKGMYLSPALKVTFDNGDALAHLCRNSWLEWDVIGNWVCQVCKAMVPLAKKPKINCLNCLHKMWQYQELTVVNTENGVSGSIDFVVDLQLPKHVMVECKTMTRDQFDTLKAPLGEHRERCQLYLMHVARTGGPLLQKVGTDRMLILYISKGFGVKNEEHGGKILPFKEFWVERDDKAVLPLYDKAVPLAKFRWGGAMPGGICGSMMDKRAKSCNCAKECWSGVYPEGKKIK